ncbi:hypothetical protein [Streptomyces chartreusis]
MRRRRVRRRVRRRAGAWHGGTTWLRSRLGSRDPDILATVFDYVAGAPVPTTAAGVRYSGAARYTPSTAGESGRAVQGKSKPRTGSDFYHYLGIPWTFPDAVTRRPEKDRARSVDSSGYVRLVYGFRSGFPLNSRDGAAGNGLQRTPDAIARGRIGRIGIHLGLDTADQPRFISSQARQAGARALGALLPEDAGLRELRRHRSPHSPDDPGRPR